MADISKITLPSGTTYDIKDAVARSQIEALTGGDAVIFIGVSSVELTDGGNETPKVDGEDKTPAAGQLFFYGTQEFIYGPDNKWHALGSLDTLGTLAYKNSASGTYNTIDSISVTTKTVVNKIADVAPIASETATYTPEGNISTPTISIVSAGATETIKNPTSETVAKTIIAVAPGVTAPDNIVTYYSVANETLSLYQLGYTTGDSITTNNVTVKTGDANYVASQPIFTGTGVHLATENIEVPDTYETSVTTGTSTITVS